MTPPVTTGGRILSPEGELAQIVNGEGFAFLAYVEFDHEGASRGHHYHEARAETLYVVRGCLHAVYADVESGEAVAIAIGVGTVATVAPRCAHAFWAQEYTQALELSDRAYDPADTQRYELARLAPSAIRKRTSVPDRLSPPS